MKSVYRERLDTYLELFSAPLSEELEKIREDALADDVPIIRRDTCDLIRFLLCMRKPESILEVGTAVGFSALFFAEMNPAPCRITTIESYEKRIPIARANFQASPYAERIELLEGDAAEILPTLEGAYDFVFMDAAKGQYINFYPEVMRLLAPGGLLVSDNVLSGRDVIESRFAIPRRNRTRHERMREYLDTITHDSRLVTDILPIGDGVSLSFRETDS
ncbi:MAG: O-methyltransferase [Eubacterium sp.]|nr:O-methyltransferase [Eubacterium sp.]